MCCFANCVNRFKMPKGRATKISMVFLPMYTFHYLQYRINSSNKNAISPNILIQSETRNFIYNSFCYCFIQFFRELYISLKKHKIYIQNPRKNAQGSFEVLLWMLDSIIGKKQTENIFRRSSFKLSMFSTIFRIKTVCHVKLA